MKSIEQVLLEIHKKECLIDYFGENIKIEDIHKDYILENLNTHDRSLLVNKLESLKEFVDVQFEEKEVIKLLCKTKIKNRDNFKNLLDFYGYYLTKEDYDVDEDRYIYYICPKYSKNCSDFIYDDCKGICFHLCLTKDVDSILHSGLRCKKANYRYFPERIYVISVPIKDIGKLKHIVQEVVDEMMIRDISKYSILKITKPSHNKGIGPDFYQDDAMNHPNTFFTYTNIPPQEIKDLGTLKKFIE